MRQRHAEPRRLLPQLPGRRRRMGTRRTTSARHGDASGQGVQIVFADSAHIKLSGTLTIPCGRSATPNGPTDRALRPEVRHRPDPEHRATRCDRSARERRRRRRHFAPLPATITTGRHELPAGRNDSERQRCPAPRRLPSWRPGSNQVGFPGGIALKLRIAHHEDNNKASASALVKAGDGSTCSVPLDAEPVDDGRRDERSVNCAGFNAVAPFEVTYSIQAGNQPVDREPRRCAAQRRLRALTIKGQNGCVVKAPGTSGYCPLISPPPTARATWSSRRSSTSRRARSPANSTTPATSRSALR